jgi:hypothetical protein
VVTSVQELREIQFMGRKHRTTAETNMNDRSSRSHALFTITIETSEPGADGKPHIRAGKLHMVDLAGSERLSKTGAVGERLEEATKINLSLSTLCHVISSLVDQKAGSFVPYRNSKLTRLLQDSLGGNTKTVMISNIGPADYNYDESLNTLRYASRAKFITNKPRINEDPKDAMIRQFQEEIEQLKIELAKIGLDPNAALEAIANGTELKPGEPRKPTMDVKRTQELLEERTKMMKMKTKEVEEEKKTIMENLRKQEEEKQKALEKQSMIRKQLHKLENRLNMHGVKLEKAKKAELDHQAAQAALQAQQVKERRLAEELKTKEAMQSQLQKKSASLKEELEDKSKQLQKAWAKYKELNTAIRDTEELFWQEREDTLSQIYEQSRTLKFLDMIIENFIPEHEKVKIEKTAQWDPENETWKFPAPKFKSAFRYITLSIHCVAKRSGRCRRSVSSAPPRSTAALWAPPARTRASNTKTSSHSTSTCPNGPPKTTPVPSPSFTCAEAAQSTRVKNAFYNILADNGDDFEYQAVYFHIAS